MGLLTHTRAGWGSPAHLRLPAFASVLFLGVDALVTVPKEGHPGVPGAHDGFSLSGGLLEGSCRQVGSRPLPPTVGVHRADRSDAFQEVTVQDWPSVVSSKHRPWEGPLLDLDFVGEEDGCGRRKTGAELCTRWQSGPAGPPGLFQLPP